MGRGFCSSIPNEIGKKALLCGLLPEITSSVLPWPTSPTLLTFPWEQFLNKSLQKKYLSQGLLLGSQAYIQHL